MKLRRDILLFSAVAVAAAAGGWWLLANRPDAAVETFKQEHQRLESAARPRSPPADAFRATVCAASPCVLVEAGGLTFIYGAGAGAGEGIRRLGMMHANIDAVLLPDLAVATVEGLAGIAEAGARAGRREPLKVFGPAGVLSIVDGANLIVASTQAARLLAAAEGEDQGLSGRVVFDSGVVTVRGFGGGERGQSRVYRVDFDGRSLILAGCATATADILAAARGTQAASAVLMAGSASLLGAEPRCIDLATVTAAVKQAKLPTSLVIPIDPSSSKPGAIPAWRDVLSAEGLAGAQLGPPGTAIDLVGAGARITPASQN